MALTVIVVTIIVVVLAYRYYSTEVDRSIIQADPKRTTPVRRRGDGLEFVPARAGLLAGYQFKSTSLDPIIGPILAVQFGWLPAILWLVAGAIFAGWVQDYAVAMLSVRNKGMSLGQLARLYISGRASNLLLVFLYIYLLLILSGFAIITAPLLARESVPFSFLSLVLAGIIAGQMIYRWRINLPVTTVTCVGLALTGIYAGTTPWARSIVQSINQLAGDPQSGVLFHQPLGFGVITWQTFFWVGAILVFCYLGAVLPLWRFAQPVNYIASWFIGLGMLAAVAGIFIATITGRVNTVFTLPALIISGQPDLGPLWPILFVTISSGAVSGWHSLVSISTARQLEKETDALPVTAGSTFTGTILAALAIVFAATLGVAAGRFDPALNYRLVAGAAGVFALGLTQFWRALGIPATFGDSLGTVFLVVLILTVLQLVLRFMRLVIAELVGTPVPAFKNPHLGALAAVLSGLVLIMPGFWQWLWVLFGGSNQLLAGIALLLVSIWLAQQAKNYHWTLWPGIFLVTTGISALIYVAGYHALYQGIFTAREPTPGAVLGNLITAVAGLWLIFTALILLIDSWRAITKARRAGLRLEKAEPGD